MKDHDLDRIIEAAAEQMVSQEPSQELTSAVMARIRAADEGSRPRRVVWATAGAGAAACAVIGVLMLNSASQPVVESPSSAASTAVTTESTAAAPLQPDSTAANARSTAASSETRPSGVRRVTRREVPASLAQSEFEALAGSVPFESIAPLPIDLPGLAMSSTQIDEISIEPITIEPLSASND